MAILLNKMLLIGLLYIYSSMYVIRGYTLTKPKALTVNCQSHGNGEEFKQRLKWRQNAEDQSTILLFKGEQLNIHFELATDAEIDVLGVVYSNDGDSDVLSVNLDGREIGRFKTKTLHAWGYRWDDFETSGPIGGMHELKAGKHDVTLKILEADVYGIEIDYIRLNVHGGKIERLNQEDLLCVHKPVET